MIIIIIIHLYREAAAVTARSSDAFGNVGECQPSVAKFNVVLIVLKVSFYEHSSRRNCAPRLARRIVGGIHYEGYALFVEVE